MFDLSRLDIEPNRFGECKTCPYLQAGTADICFACASRELAVLPTSRCEICAQSLTSDGRCPNAVCNWDDRFFSSIYAISTFTGTLKHAIYAYKYDSHRGWAGIFGRVLVGFLDSEGIDSYDVISASPTYLGEGGRSWDHTGLIVEKAGIEAAGAYPFDVGSPGIVVQTAPTRRFAKLKWSERRDEAEGPLRAALQVPDAAKVDGKRVLLFDDVFTEGLRTREVARALISAGADEVSQVVLARMPAPSDWT